MKYFLTISLLAASIHNTMYPIHRELARRYGLNSYITRTPLWFKDPKKDETRIQRTKYERRHKLHASKIKQKEKVKKRLAIKSDMRRRDQNNQRHPFAY